MKNHCRVQSEYKNSTNLIAKLDVVQDSEVSGYKRVAQGHWTVQRTLVIQPLPPKHVADLVECNVLKDHDIQ